MASSKIDRQIWPAVVAHRGASSTHPENTVEAFHAAADAGADFIELDVRLTADGHLVVLHDADVSRTTNGTGMVHQMTLAQVKALDVVGGERSLKVPTLEEVLHEMSGLIGVDVEIKNRREDPGGEATDEAVAERCVETVVAAAFQGSIVLSSFDASSIERVRELEPDIPTGFIASALTDVWDVLGYARTRGHELILPQSPGVFEAGPELVEAAHDAGVLVGPWTVDDAEAVERLFAMGVDAVATNDPAMAVGIRDRFRAARPA
jgi:glycerophosphoryl diester phosphodiesterase